MNALMRLLDRLLPEEPVIHGGRDWSRLVLTGGIVLTTVALLAALAMSIASFWGFGWLLLEPTGMADNICLELDNGQGNGTLVPRSCEGPDYTITGLVGSLAIAVTGSAIRAIWPRKVHHKARKKQEAK
jgi:hypothetical protein